MRALFKKIFILCSALAHTQKKEYRIVKTIIYTDSTTWIE